MQRSVQTADRRLACIGYGRAMHASCGQRTRNYICCGGRQVRPYIADKKPLKGWQSVVWKSKTVTTSVCYHRMCCWHNIMSY